MKLKRFILKNAPSFRLAGALFCLWMGAYLAVPIHGFLATLPLFVPFSLLAAYLERRPAILLPSAFLAGLFFEAALESQAEKWPRAVAFGLFLLLTALLSLSAVRLFFGKKNWYKFFSFLAAAAAVALHLVWNGVPHVQAAKEREREEYLSRRYPEESFTSAPTFLDRKTGDWVTFARFTYEGNEMEAELRGGETLEDGYFAFLAGRYADHRRSDLLSLLRVGYEGDFSVDDARLSARAASIDRIHSLPGQWDEAELSPYLVFTVTLENTPKKRDFDREAERMYSFFAEKGVLYGELVLIGADGGTPRFTVRLTPGTGKEAIPSLTESLLKENPLK